MTIDVAAILREYGTRKSTRSTWDTYWEDCSRYLSPRMNEFNRDAINPVEGERRTQYIYDSTPVIAAGTFATVVDSSVTPRNETWQHLVADNADLMRIGRVARYYDDVTALLFRARYQGSSNFATQKHESYYSMGIFGHGILFIDEMVGKGIRYKSEHIKDVWLAENSAGIIDSAFRAIYLTARQWAQKFGEDKLPPRVKQALKDNPEQKFELCHYVCPNEKYEIGTLGKKGMKFSSIHIGVDDQIVMQEGGYRTFPYSIDRALTAPRSVYAYSPGMMALNDIKTLNEMSRTDLIASQRMAQPPLLLSDDGVLTKVNMKANALNFGGLDSNGVQLVRPLETNARPDIAEEKMEQRRKVIRDAFLVNLFQIMIENPRMSATEVLEKSKEKASLITPMLGRVQEAISTQTERELDIMANAGVLPQMPPELVEAQGEYKIVFESPLTRMQGSTAAVGTRSQIQVGIELVAAGIEDALDIYNLDEAQRVIAQANAVPARVMADEKETAAKREARAEQKQMAMMMQAAPLAGKAAKDMAQAGQIAQQTGA
jgi:hypothetical protein